MMAKKSTLKAPARPAVKRVRKGGAGTAQGEGDEGTRGESADAGVPGMDADAGETEVKAAAGLRLVVRDEGADGEAMEETALEPADEVASVAGGRARKAGGRKGAADAGTKKKAEVAAMRPFDEGAVEQPPGFERWLERARVRGLQGRGLVWELHVVQGRSLAETGRLLGLDAGAVVALHAEMRAEMAGRAPRSEADFQAVREEVRERLVSVIEDASRAPEDPRLLAVRQRACDQLAELYGLKMQRRGNAGETAPVYAPTEEIAAAVEVRVRSLYGREKEIEEARRLLNGE